MLKHHMEFRADAYSAKLMGNGKPLANALKIFYEHAKQEEDRLFAAMKSEGVSDFAISQKKMISDFIKKIFHPSPEARINRLNSM